MAKESLFNILTHLTDFSDIAVLDLFAGTGSISYEFISRGAREVTAVEQNIKCVIFIKQTAAGLRLENLSVVRADVFRFLHKTKKQWDLIFADPPFGLDGVSQLPDIVFERDLLAKGGMMILEHGKETVFDGHPLLFDHRVYSRVNFSFFAKERSST